MSDRRDHLESLYQAMRDDVEDVDDVGDVKDLEDVEDSGILPYFRSPDVISTLEELKRTLSQMSMMSNARRGQLHGSSLISGGVLRLLLDCGLLRALKRCLQPLKTNKQTTLPEEAVHRPILALLSTMALLPTDLKTTGAGLPRLMAEYGRHAHVSSHCANISRSTRLKWISLLTQSV